MTKLTFDASTVEPAEGFTPVPAGRYNVIITESAMMYTKKGDGSYLKLVFKIIEGEHVNRLLWVNLNLDNPNSKAVEIAQRELSAICHACDLTIIEDSQELHGIPISAQVKIRPANGPYAPSNSVSGYKEAIETTEEEEAPWA
jgi:hypothetical protein